MNYYEARRRSESDPAVWDYTCMRDGRTWPIGYCAETVGCPAWSVDEPFERCDETCEHCHGTQRVPNPDYCGGHSTSSGASECYARYSVAQGCREREYLDWTGCRKKVERDGELVDCDVPTKKVLRARSSHGLDVALCDEHRTEDAWRDAQPRSAGVICSSY